MRGIITLLPSALLLVSGCNDDEPPSPTNSGATWTYHAAAQVDTAFIMAPNLVTPNADGINDVFAVIGMNISSLRTDVLRMNGDTAFYSDDLQPVWSDIDSSDLGRYRVHLQAMAISGRSLVAQGYLDVAAYGVNDCLALSGTPVTGDQFDPRVFGVTYPSNENFCP